MSIEQRNNHIEQVNCNKEVKEDVLKRYLFVCFRNERRSPASASYFKKLIKEKNINAVVESAGTSDSAERKLTEEMVKKSNVVFAMDESIFKEIVKRYSPPEKKLVNLDILDIYDHWGNVCDDLLRRETQYQGESILERPEIKGRLELYEALEMKKPILEKYIGDKFVFVGEKRSNRAIEMNVNWQDGKLAARSLIRALRASGINYQEQVFLNLFYDKDGYEIRSYSSEKIKELAKNGAIIVGMGKLIQKHLEKLGIKHLKLTHPAARGKIRKKETYTEHVSKVLGVPLSIIEQKLFDISE